MKNLLTTLLVIALLLTSVVKADNETVCIYFFYGETCPHCAQEKPFLKEMSEKYPKVELHTFEVYFNKDNQRLFQETSKLYGVKASGVPTTFIGEKVFVGYVEGEGDVFDPNTNSYVGYRSAIEKTIEEYLETGAPCPNIKIENSQTTNESKINVYLLGIITITLVAILLIILKKIVIPKKIEKKLVFLVAILLFPGIALSKDVNIPIIGNLNTDLPLPLLGIILGFLDGGFNPCALSVLLFLVAYLISLGSKKKTLIIGLTYSSVIFVVYFLFMLGILNVISIIGYIEILKKILGVIIVVIGVVEVKDFFWYGKWFSLEIPKFAKPTIERLTKSATVTSAIILGIFVSIVEIPCAGAFPLIYLTLLAERVSPPTSILYLVLYNIFFVLPLMILTAIFYFGWMKVEKAEETRIKLRRYMRLVSGLIMIVLGLSLFFKIM